MPEGVEGTSASAEIVTLMRDGQWVFDLLGPGFLDEMVRRVQGVSGEERPRLRALPSYRLAALALKAVDRDVAFDGEDGASRLLDLNGGEQLPSFWRALLHSFNTGVYTPDTPPVDYCRPTAAHHQALDAALAILKERAPRTHAAFTTWLTRIMVVQGAQQGGSSPRFFGCILQPANLFAISPRLFAPELVHELAHQEIFVLNAYDRLTAPEGDEVWRFSPFPRLSRPTMGRLHAAHALFRIIQLSRQTGEGTFIKRSKLRRTARSFKKGELTALGQTLVNEVYRNA